MKVILVQPPEDLERLLGKGKHFVMPVPPVGLMYIGAMLEKNGYHVGLLDAYHKRLNVQETAVEVLKESPDVIGISCLTANGANVFNLAKELKQLQPKD